MFLAWVSKVPKKVEIEQGVLEREGANQRRTRCSRNEEAACIGLERPEDSRMRTKGRIGPVYFANGN